MKRILIEFFLLLSLLMPMKSLDKVKELYADNFEVVKSEESTEYYYKLPFADYYLTYEGYDPLGNYYVYHLYEFVVDEPESGIGHTVTYGWYAVDVLTGEVTDNTFTVD